MPCLRMVLPAVVLLVSVGCRSGPVAHTREPAGNVVAEYLDGAELQAETNDQRGEVKRALSDMLEKRTPELRSQTYRDYEGRPGVWPVTLVLARYFVPQQPRTLDDEAFYRDVGKPEAKAATKRQLERVNKALGQTPP